MFVTLQHRKPSGIRMLRSHLRVRSRAESWIGYLAEADHVYLGDLAELDDNPFVRLALILQEGVAVAVQNRLWLARLLVGGHYFGAILGQRKVVALLLLFRLVWWCLSLHQVCCMSVCLRRTGRLCASYSHPRRENAPPKVLMALWRLAYRLRSSAGCLAPHLTCIFTLWNSNNSSIEASSSVSEPSSETPTLLQSAQCSGA